MLGEIYVLIDRERERREGAGTISHAFSPSNPVKLRGGDTGWKRTAVPLCP